MFKIFNKEEKTVSAKLVVDALQEAKGMNKYHVNNDPTTYKQYNKGWQEAVDYIWKIVKVGYKK